MSGHHNNGCGCGGNCAGNCSGGCGGIGASALERVRYFSRQVVTAADLTRDQEYFRDSLRRHNRLLHGWGVVCGARVRAVPGTCQLVVEPGYILGPQGDEIVIDREVTIDACQAGLNGESLDPCAAQVDPWCTNVRVDRPDGRPLYLAIRYDQCPTRPVRVPAGGCGGDTTACEYSRIKDSFAVKILHELPASYANLRPAPATPSFLQQPTADHGRDTQYADPPAARRCGSPCPPCPEDPWVILADLFIQDGKVIFVDCFNNRRLVASFADFYHLCPPAKPKILKLTFSPPAVIAGDSTTGTVTLAAPAPAGGVTVDLKGLPKGPAQLVIPQGAVAKSFNAGTEQEVATPILSTASIDGEDQAAASIKLSVLNDLVPQKLNQMMPVSESTTFRVTLSERIPYDCEISLESSDKHVVFPPASVRVTQEQIEATFVAALGVGTATLTASLNGVTQVATIEISTRVR